ncbi:hypothetical protein PLEOSDRAFT_167693 [Pleurotus ostreatus PC15]|uniref:Uncharacterized protein n=1 Tax=Pleurotus ostreatus (strain PC15) TaxID=1137138 RepID=A0A067NPS0_PLEO1|nr:hypothetical protein PLEOSDRAFT_167693 [Pleurotus ostreatus PC15]
MWAMEDAKLREPQNGFIVSHLAYGPAGWVFLVAEEILMSNQASSESLINLTASAEQAVMEHWWLLNPTREKPVEWTALDILIAYAGSKGWVTAKAGRPDMNRAGNDILRALVEGRIAWAFWPPGTDITVVDDNNGNGVWLHEFDRLDAEFDDHEEDSAEQEDADEGVSSEINSEGDGVSEDEAVGGRFDALSLEEESEEEEVEEEEKEEDRP